MAQRRPEASGNGAQQSPDQASALMSAFAARKITKNPFADITNRDRGITNGPSQTHLLANYSDGRPPPLKRQKLGYDNKVAPRRLHSERDLKPRRTSSPGTVPEVHQANHGTVIVHTASTTRTNLQIPTQPRNHVNEAERERDFEEENFDTEYGTDVEDDPCVSV